MFKKKKKESLKTTPVRLKKGMKYWFIQPTVACSLKITRFIKKRKIKKSLKTLSAPGSSDLPAKNKK